MLLLVPHIILSKNPRPAGIGGPLGAIGMLGLAGLVVWAVLPRWRALVPASAHGAIGALRRTAPARAAARLLGGYERWRTLHRTTGVFVAAGFLHGALNGTIFSGAPVLRAAYLAVGGIGLGFYIHRELLARHFRPMHDYTVRAVRALGDGLTEISLAPLGRPLRFVPGQFAMVCLEAKDGWHRHPFTISSSADERHVRFTIKALGDYTSRLSELVQIGMPAVISGPHGRFDRRRGTAHQAWIAAGVGIAPFLSWLRSLEQPPSEQIDLYYTSTGPAPFAEEIAAIAERHPSLRVQVIDTSTEGRLTPEHVIAQAVSTSQVSPSTCAARHRCCAHSKPTCAGQAFAATGSIASTSTGAERRPRHPRGAGLVNLSLRGGSS